jgi:SAM-dependent methyltransferase
MNQNAFLQRACPACGASAPKDEVRSDPPAETLSIDALRPYWSGLFKEKVFFSYDRCGQCGLLFAPAYFTPEQLGELYNDMAPNMEVVPTAAIEATQRSYWDTARKVGPLNGGYLEIGPDVGYIVRHAVRDGNFDRFWLFEPNKAVHAQLADATEGRPHEISVEMDDLSIVPDESVGLAVMVHVLDHVLDPMASLQRVRAKLKPGGVLMIVTHNERSVLRKLMSTRWPPFCLQHPELYNPASMEQILRRAEYSGVDVERSKNYFPIAFMVRQAAYTVGLNLEKLPLPRAAIGLRLGNMITLARR